MQIVLHVTLDAKATGPALEGIAAKYEMAWLYKWVKNSSELIKSGPQAVKVYEENNKAVMSAFPQLSNADIDNIIAYTSEPKVEAAPAVVVALRFLDLLIMALQITLF
jgi:mono/diheme cytochrome c family protein